ncbi:MAG: type I glutamate--ammonia ligase [Campylobacterales bacterium]|jgi:glutamine synthetase
MTVTDFLKECREKGIEFIDFRFTDIKGTWHHVTYDIESVDEEMFNEGISFDGSSIPAWQPINESDMLLKPDLEIGTHFEDPFTADPTMVVFCDVYNTDGTPYEKCPRSIAKWTLQYLRECGIGDVAYFGPENEFFVFDKVIIRDEKNSQCYEVDTIEGGWNDFEAEFGDELNIGHRPRTKGGYFPVPPTDSMMDLRAEMVKVLKQIGLKTFVLHHEVAQGQGEIGIQFGTLVEAADNIQKLKYVIKMVAHLNGKTATFMPKPIFGDNGNGMHTHQSIWKDGKNLFFDPNGPEKLSKIALQYIAGVFDNIDAVAAFTNASSNSYKRLQPGFEAPKILAYSGRNRSAACRIPYGSGEKSIRIELRFPDSSANPYLAFSVLLLAGLDGIRNQKEIYEAAREPMNEDLFELSQEEIKARGIKTIPSTLREALYGLEKAIEDPNSFLKVTLKNGNRVFSDLFLKSYLNHKYEVELIPVEGRPHPYEFITTFSC